MCPIPICIWLFFFLFKLKSERKSTWKVFLLLSHTLVWYSWRDILSKHVMFLLWSYIDVRDEIRVMHKEHRLVQGRRKKKKKSNYFKYDGHIRRQKNLLIHQWSAEKGEFKIAIFSTMRDIRKVIKLVLINWYVYIYTKYIYTMKNKYVIS